MRELLLHAERLHDVAAGDAVEFLAQRRDPLLVGVLHLHLARDGRANQIVAVDQIAGGADIGGQEKPDSAEREARRQRRGFDKSASSRCG